LDDRFRAEIVRLILEGKAEKVLNLLAEEFEVERPKIKVKHVKGHSKALALYSAKDKTIYLSDGTLYTNPYVILHEFYHHIRMVLGKHRGTEKHANRFAASFLSAYKRLKRDLSLKDEVSR